ncbi:MAG: YraN family protein, partial [Anaerolineae bacterium]|nr:YraN family protein [Anaerolineae bacterium]
GSLEQRMDSLGKAFGAFQRAFGSTVEEEAASVIEVVLRRKGYRVLQPAYALPIDSEGEVDVVLPVVDPAGRQIWVVVEAKARLSRRDVQSWVQRMRSVEWRRQLAERGCAGPYLVYAYSIRMDLGAQELAEIEGIGLLKSDGELLAPRDLIEPADAQ